MYFDGNDFRMNDDDFQYDKNHSNRKGKKSLRKRKKNEDFERGFSDNRKRNKPRRGNKDYDF